MTGSSTGILGVGGVAVGHWTDAQAGTGCTVAVFEPRAVCGVDVRGGAPGTREIALLDPVCHVDRVDAIVLTGGSALGLASASGVALALRAEGRGYQTSAGAVPIVPAAVVFDLSVGDAVTWPDDEAGKYAYKAASNHEFAEGNVGAGAGATSGSASGARLKTGIGTVLLEDGDIRVGALVVPNPVGSIVDGRGNPLSGDQAPAISSGPDSWAGAVGENTVIGIVATNARLDKVGATKVAQMANDGIARAVSPAHTMADGDTLFCVSAGHKLVEADISRVGHMAAEAVAEAIRRGALLAEPAYGLESASSARQT
ncbi:MAG: P1 family peptidase [Chloroflexi bacterium]|nr:P1 family peptidase [Chloroflexota bacterium]MCY3938536.1 P1 family peptidase [Chloroflexota bacterium]